MKRLFAAVSILLFFASLTYSQNGFLRGRVIDAETGEALIGVTIVAPSVNAGTITDFDGNYSLSLNPGSYNILISYVSYETQNHENVEIKAGEVTIINANMAQATMDIEEVVITARVRERTEAAIQVKQRKAPVVLDGISSEQISRLGDSDAASALKRVTGVSVQGGKYVYVRGLSDRYMKVTLNGAEIPGLDPNFNTVQMDLFPSNVVENLTVLKTYSPDQPSFIAGLVDIGTRTFPEKFSLKFSASTGFNSNTHFRDDFLTYEGSNTDWLGYDNGTRDIPGYVQGIALPRGISSNADTLYKLSSAFNKIWDAETKTALLNQSYSLSVGGQTSFLGKPLGLLGAVSYKRDFEFYERGRLDEYELNTEDLVSSPNLLDETKGSESVIWSGLFSGNLKLNNWNRISLNYLRNQNGLKNTRFMDGSTSGSDNYELEQTSLEYLERSLSALQMIGKHVFPELNNLTIEWMSSYTHSIQDEPDLRFFITETDEIDGEVIYDTRSNRKPERRYREMWESNWNTRLDITIPVDIAGSEVKFKVGGSYLDKYRDSDEDRYTGNRRGVIDFNGTPSHYFRDSALMGGVLGPQGVYYANDITNNRNLSYSGQDQVTAAYVMADFRLFERLRVSTGIRAEYGTMYIANKIDTTIGDNPSLLGIGESEDLDFLPSVNLTYALQETMNLRFSYSRGIGRPSFRERAPYEFYEYTEGLSILGNPDLDRVIGSSYDFRWEYFFKPGEMASFSLFYKDIQNPIERYKRQTTTQISTYRNGYESEVYGMEIEFRKKLDFAAITRDFSLGTNITLSKSVTQVDTLRLRLAQQLVEDFPEERPIYAQSPYVVNAYLNYLNARLGLEANLAFNVEGPKIVIISKLQTPDVYERPRPLLNFNISKQLGKAWDVSFSVKNILDSEFNQSIILDNGEEYPFRRHFLGREFSLGVSYTI